LKIRTTVIDKPLKAWLPQYNCHVPGIETSGMMRECERLERVFRVADVKVEAHGIVYPYSSSPVSADDLRGRL
jgi:hypothetical protein